MSNRVQTKGTLFKLSIASVYTAIGGVSSLDIKFEEPGFADTTPLDCGDISEVNTPTGVADPGSVDFELFLDPEDTAHQALVAINNAGVKDFKIENPNISGFTREFSGSLSGYTETYKAKGHITSKGSVKCSTAITVA